MWMVVENQIISLPDRCEINVRDGVRIVNVDLMDIIVAYVYGVEH